MINKTKLIFKMRRFGRTYWNLSGGIWMSFKLNKRDESRGTIRVLAVVARENACCV